VPLTSGWIPDYPDPRDYSARHVRVQTFLKGAGVLDIPAALPPRIDLTATFPPVADQGPLHSCTAFTTAALVSYFQRTAHDRVFLPSPLFLYKLSRNLLGSSGDTGSYLRTSMSALRLFGVVPEERWPYDPAQLDVEPQTFHYMYAANYKASVYYRLDPPGTDRAALLRRVRANLAAQLPAMFGVYLFPSLQVALESGAIPLPSRGEQPTLLHALVAVGYDDGKDVQNPLDRVTTTGALRVRSSWGPLWGDGGHGWLPYESVLRGITSDWWSLVEADFVDTGQFGLR
jgi:C1A family cysteine protease